MEGTKNSDIRVNNRKRLLNTLFRQGAMTKLDLANKLEISLPTATLLLKELMQKGLVEKGEILHSTGGRKPMLMAPVYDAKYAVGIEVSMFEIRMALVDIGGRLHAKALWSHGIQTEREFWEMVDRLVEGFIQENIPDPSRLLHVGLTLQMPIDHGVVCLKKKDLGRWQFDLEKIRSCFQYPIDIQNSARMAATAQIWSGVADENFVFLSIGTYVSGAIVFERKVLDFEIPNGMFGSILAGDGYLEDYLSTRSLSEKAHVHDMEQLFREIKDGNEQCQLLWKEYLNVLVRTIYNLRKIFGYRVIIGGGICPYLEPYENQLNQRLCEMEEFEDVDPVYVKVSDLGVYGASMGAAMLAIDHFLEFGYEEI